MQSCVKYVKAYLTFSPVFALHKKSFMLCFYSNFVILDKILGSDEDLSILFPINTICTPY